MKTKSSIVCTVILLLAVPLQINAGTPKRKASRPQKSPSASNELQELLRRNQQALEQAQTEARRAREQREELLKRLDENTRELTRLRQTVEDFGLRMAELKSSAESSQPTQVTQAQQPEQSATPKPQSTIEERVEYLQEQIDLNTAQIKEHAQTKVESD